MLPPHPLLLATLLPLLASALACLLGRALREKTGWLVGLILMGQVGLLGLLAYRVWLRGPVSETYAWAPLPGISVELLGDGLSLPVALVIALICACLAFYSVRYVEYRVETLYPGERERWGHYYAIYYAFFPLLPLSLVGLTLAGNLFMMWFFMELPLAAFYFLLAYFGYEDRHRIALMCFLWGTVASMLFMAGAFMVYARLGSFSLSALPRLAAEADRSWALAACTLMAVGLLVKMAAFGFHVWLPWVHANTPTSIAGIFATYANIGAYLMARVLALGLPDVFASLSLPLMIWALITMIYGALLTLAQDDVKRLCACSTISQIGYTLLGVASGSPMAVAGAIFYMISHILGKAVIFSTAGLLVYSTHERDIKRMGGLGRELPVTAVLWALGAMMLSAIPPFCGLAAEIVMFLGIFRSALTDALKLAIAICGVLATALTAAYTFWPLKRIFMGQPRGGQDSHIKKAPLSMLVPLFVLALASAVLGLCPRLALELFARVLEAG